MGPSRTGRRRTVAAAAAVLFCTALLGACGGGGADTGAPAAPAAEIDPSSDDAVTGPVNRARQAAEAQEARDRAIEQAGELQP